MDEQFSDDSSNYFPAEYEEEPVAPATKRQRFSKPKVCDSSFWSNENIKKLITNIKQHSEIWKTDSDGFKSRTQRETAWQQVFEAFGNENIDTNQLVAKWQNLRTQYRSVRATARKYAFKKPAWRFYADMAFIDQGEASVQKDNDTNITLSSSAQQVENTKVKRVQIPKVVDLTFWNEENVIKLIDAVKKRKSIWSVNTQYKQRDARELDWHSVAEEFKKKIAVNLLVAKWQNLRTLYRAATIQNSNWKYAAHMNFLDENVDILKKSEEVQITVTQFEQEQQEDLQSISATEDYNVNDFSSEAFIQSDYEDSIVKEEHVEEHVDTFNDNDPLHKNQTDNLGIFGNFLISELRKIRSEAYLETTKRKILQFVWKCIDEEPVES